jgi:hypothetical protein
VLEGVLVDQRLGRLRPQQRQLDAADANCFLSKRRQSSASSPTVRPGGSPGSFSSASRTPAENAVRDVVS